MRIQDGRVSRRQIGQLLGAVASMGALPAWCETPKPVSASTPQPIRFRPLERAIGDVMPFYHDGKYHIFYLLNASGNFDINWEHAVSTDLVHWTNLPPAILRDPSDVFGPEGDCMFTGSVIAKDRVFHAFYTSRNQRNPKGRQFISHATSSDLITWTKHPDDMIAPDGIHYASHHGRDFRDPCVVWDDGRQRYMMYILGNRPGKTELVYGLLSSSDLRTWKQEPAINGIPGDDCPDFFTIGDTRYLHGCNFYAFAQGNGPWTLPERRKLDRRMAAKRVFDGKRHIWFGGWLNGPMSVPRELYQGPDRQLFMKPVEEVVNAFSATALAVRDVKLSAGKPRRYPVPDGYLLETEFELERGADLILTVREPDGKSNTQIVISPREGGISALGGQNPSFGEIPFSQGQQIGVRAFIDGGVAEFFVNDQYAATCLIGIKGGSLSMEARGTAKVHKLDIKVRD